MQTPKHLVSICALVGGLAFAGCQTIPVEVPKVTEQAAVEIADPFQLARIKFDRVGVKLKRGTAIGAYEPNVLGFNGCYGRGGNIFWNRGRVRAGCGVRRHFLS